MEEQPTKFNLQVAGNVSGSDLYKNLAISELNINDNMINGTLFNSGVQEITVPQLLISYYDQSKKMLWVDHLFIKDGIRQQRKKVFEYQILNSGNVKLINDTMENIFVNGLPNKSISNKIVPNRIENHTYGELQKINHPDFSYIRIETNSYIGNPN